MKPLRQHPLYPKLRTILKSSSGELKEPVTASVYRCVELQWARSEYLVSGKWTRLRGSRWLMSQITQAVYASYSETIALKESQQTFAYYGIKRPKKKPRVSVANLVHCHRNCLP